MSAVMHRLGQLRKLDLIALALRHDGAHDETRFAAMSREALIDLLTRDGAQ